jgi:hypothetical protein
MQTSGAGGRDSLMTIVPLGMLALLVVWLGGGPRSSLALVENLLRTLVTWVGSWIR